MRAIDRVLRNGGKEKRGGVLFQGSEVVFGLLQRDSKSIHRLIRICRIYHYRAWRDSSDVDQVSSEGVYHKARAVWDGFCKLQFLVFRFRRAFFSAEIFRF